MRRSWKKFLIVTLMALGSLLLLAGCKIGRDSLDDIKQEYQLDAIVTYYANGGEFENTLGVKDLYYKAGVQPLEIREKGATANISVDKDGYDFIAWYHAEVDGDGNIVFEEGSAIPKKSDIRADFNQYLAKGDHWTLVAEWKIKSRVKVEVVGQGFADGETMTIGGQSYKAGDVVKEYAYSDTNKVEQPRRLTDFTPTGEYTFVEFYADSACTQLCSWPIERQDEDVVIYARYIKGNWKVVKDASGVSTMFGVGVGVNDKFLIINDIDCKNMTVAPMSTKFFAGVVQGDGKAYKISNLKVETTISTQIKGTSVLGEIQSTAVIKDVIFENISVSFKTAYITNDIEIPVYLLYTSLANGATVENVVFQGSFNIEYKGTTYNNTNVLPDGNGGWTGWLAGTTEAGAETAKAGFNTDGITITVVGYPVE